MGRSATRFGASASDTTGPGPVTLEVVDGYAIVPLELAQQHGFNGASEAAERSRQLPMEQVMQTGDATANTSPVDAEIDAIPIPEADKMSAARPGETPATAFDDAAPSSAPPVAGEVTEEQAKAAAAGHKPMVHMLIDGLASSLLPNWRITKEEVDDLADKFSLALGYWWPDGTVPPKWAATIMAAYAGYMIVRERRNDDGTWQPRKIITVKREATRNEVPVSSSKGAGSGTGAGGEV